MNRDIWMILLGSLLAFSGGLASFFIQTWWHRKLIKNNTLNLLKWMIGSISSVISRIEETYEKTNLLWNDLLYQISLDLTIFEQNREISLISVNPSIRQQVYDWCMKTRTNTSLSLGLNQMLLSNPQNDWVKNDIPQKIQLFKELKNDASKLIEKLK